MKYRIQEGCEVSKTFDNSVHSTKEEIPNINYDEFRDRFKTWEQIRAERYNC